VVDAVRGPLSACDTVLDVGTGSGGIAAALVVRATLYATDRTDQRTEMRLIGSTRAWQPTLVIILHPTTR